MTRTPQTSIHVCPRTCATVEANPNVKATVVFGYATEPSSSDRL